jgi:hypothetical protein
MAPGTDLPLFADDTYIFVSENHERHVPCKLQSGLPAVNGNLRRYISPEELETLMMY